MRGTNNSYVIINSKNIDETSFRDEEWWEIEQLLDDTRLMRRILDGKYQNNNLSKIVLDSKKFSSDEQSMLYGVLTKYKFIFNRTLGTCKMKPVEIELQPGAKYYHSKPYPVPLSHESVFWN